MAGGIKSDGAVGGSNVYIQSDVVIEKDSDYEGVIDPNAHGDSSGEGGYYENEAGVAYGPVGNETYSGATTIAGVARRQGIGGRGGSRGGTPSTEHWESSTSETRVSSPSMKGAGSPPSVAKGAGGVATGVFNFGLADADFSADASVKPMIFSTAKKTYAGGSSKSAGVVAGGLSNIDYLAATDILKENMKGDTVQIDDNFYDANLDSSVQARLSEYGISLLRPEIIGCFEFLPPLESSFINLDTVYNSTGAGELIDMHTQLKQLRYAEAISALCSKMELGLESISSGGVRLTGKSINPNAPQKKQERIISSAANSQQMIDEYDQEILNSKLILDFLSTALGVQDLRSAVSIKTNFYDGFNSSTVGKAIDGVFSRYNTDFIKNIAPGKLSLEIYLREQLSCPDEWWYNASNTAIVMQLLADCVGRTVVPLKDYKLLGSNLQSNGQSGTPFDKGTVPGIDKELFSGKGGDYAAIEQLGKYEYTKIVATGGTVGDYIDSDLVGTVEFTKGDFMVLWDKIVTQKDPTCLYMVARDFINQCVAIGSTEDAAESLALESVATEDLLTDLIGWNPLKPQSNLSSFKSVAVGDQSKGAYGVKGLRPQVGDPSKNESVANFNLGTGDTIPNAGANVTLDGMKYYLDNFFQDADFSDNLAKLNSFKFSLETMLDVVGTHMVNSFVPSDIGEVDPLNWTGLQEDDIYKLLLAANDGADVRMTGFNSDSLSQSTVAAAGLTQRIFEETSEAIQKYFREDMMSSKAGSNKANSVAPLFLIAALQDGDMAWEYLKYFMLRDRTRYFQNSTPVIMNKIDDVWGDKIANFFGFDVVKAVNDSDQLQTQFGEEGDDHEIRYYGYGYDLDGKQVNLGVLPNTVSTDYDGVWYEAADTVGHGSHHAYIPSWQNWLKDALLQPYSGDSTDPDDIIQNAEDVTSTDPRTLDDAILDAVSRAVWQWDIRVMKSTGVGFDKNPYELTSSLGLSRESRLIVGYIFFMMIVQQTQRFAVYLPHGQFVKGASSQTGGTNNQGASKASTDDVAAGEEWAGSGTSNLFGILWSPSKRAVASLSKANNEKSNTPSTDAAMLRGELAYDDATWNWKTGLGRRDEINDIKSLYYTYVIPQMEWDILAWNSFSYLADVCELVISTINSILSTFQSLSVSDISNVSNLSIDELNGILSLAGEDQLRLCRAMYESLGSASRYAPHLPSGEAISTHQAKALGLMCQLPAWKKSNSSGRKWIFSMGIPTGMMKFLRASASSSKDGDYRFDKSNIIKISLYRKNLVTNDNTIEVQEYIFDVSKFIINNGLSSESLLDVNAGIVLNLENDNPLQLLGDDGNGGGGGLKGAAGFKRPGGGSTGIDSSVIKTLPGKNLPVGYGSIPGVGMLPGNSGKDSLPPAPGPSSLADLFSGISVKTLGRWGVIETTEGAAYSTSTADRFSSSATVSQENLVDAVGNAPVSVNSSYNNNKNALKQIFNNTVIDSYLKLYLLLTTGIDIEEDTFQFSHSRTSIPTNSSQFSGGRAKIFESFVDLMEMEYEANDLADGITFERVISEVARSILFSPDKYKNKIVFPKIFDRVFCILVDDNSWNATESKFESVGDFAGRDISPEGVGGIPADAIAGKSRTDARKVVVQLDEDSIATSSDQSCVPEYYHYFATASIMTEVDIEELASTSDTPGLAKLIL